MSNPGLTLQERYFAINENLNLFLKSKNVVCPVIKYGVDIATLKTDSSKPEKIYPYAKTFIANIVPNWFSSEGSGHYTEFDYQLNYFTSPKTEFENDAVLYKPFEFIQLAFTDINLSVLAKVIEGKPTMLANLLRLSVMPGFKVESGAVTPSMILKVKLAAVCGYPESLGDFGIATDLDGIINFQI